jgi:4-diphosphocytidyl-2-C-methyl-D-erythritol kinase
VSANVSTQNQETGYAKLNLALHIRGRRPDGYHELETIFAFVDQGDIISVSPDRSLSLTISGPFADGLDVTDNLVMSAAKILQNEHDRPIGAKLHLVKNLPVASGIGGGSADAAATMRLLNRHWALCFNQDELERLAMPLGADVPACIASNTVIGKGIGQDLLTIENDQLSDMHVLLANPLVGISTGEIFQKWDGVDLGPLCSDDILQALSTGRNDLQPIAMAMEETIDPLLTALMSTNPISAKMSGSGATCFGIYHSRERAIDAESAIQSAIGNVWTMTGQLR